ncbi:MAG: hypothetical protein ABIO70_30510 [Pseudomonadota bacterium]
MIHLDAERRRSGHGLDREGVFLVQLSRGDEVLAATERRFPQ